MKKILASAIAILCAHAIYAQSLGTGELSEIKESFKNTSHDKAMQNVLSGNTGIAKLSKNRQLEGKLDHYFKYRVDVSGITDQKASGRCWMFTSMNVLRPSVMEKFNVAEFDFSHNYNYFWDIFEKSNLFLENAIRTADRDIFMDRDVAFYFQNPVNDGGVWNMFLNIAGKYGVVPSSVMPETAHSDNTAYLLSIVNKRLRKGGYDLREMLNSGASLEDAENAKLEILKDVYRVLALCLGEPPASFSWRYEDRDGNICCVETTPLDFYHSIIPDDYDENSYIMIMNDPTREYYKLYDISNYRNTVEGVNWVYLNLPVEDIKKAALASIKNGDAMYASCDMPQFDAASGIASTGLHDYESLFGIDLDMDKKARILTRDSGSAHAMALVAVDTDVNDVPVKWQFENSWGANSCHDGYITFTDDWFDEYVFRIVINKKYLDRKALSSLKGEPEELPAWDYMF